MEEENQNLELNNLDSTDDSLIRVSGMYKDWFLDYASYVILERAVPSIEDGFKPVQRRILHSMKDLDDGRFNKVANIVGHTMQFSIERPFNLKFGVFTSSVPNDIEKPPAKSPLYLPMQK